MTNKRILLGAAIFYLAICPFFFHPDLKIIYQLASFLTQGVFNIYEFYAANTSIFHLGPFVYPPLAYFVMGSFCVFANWFAGDGFVNWLNMGNTAVETAGIFRYLLAIKLPLIAVHLLSGWLLTKNPRTLAMWLFNPISIYVVVLMGQIDGLAVLGVIAALRFAKSRPILGAVSLGLGAAIKSFPLLLLPFYCLLVGRTWMERLKLALMGGGVYMLFILPYLKTPAFYEHTLTSGLSQRLLTFNVSGVPLVPLTILGLAGVALVRDLGNKQLLTSYFLVTMMVVLSGVSFHPQWALWALPMIVLQKNKWISLSFLVAWFATVFSFADRFLSWGLFSPFEKSALYLPAPITLLSEYWAGWVSRIGPVLMLIIVIWAGYLYVLKKHEIS